MTISFTRIRLTAFATLIALTAASTPSFELREEVLPNFHRVNEQLYRGGQPSSGGSQQLASLGIRTIINLRGEDELSRAENEEAKRAGLRYFSMPLSGF